MTLQAVPVKTSAEVRAHIMDALRLDLIGPRPGHGPHAKYEDELIPQAPSQWYLAGFLVPSDAPPMERSDDDGDEMMDELGEVRESDDESLPEPAAAQKAFFPSSAGLSVLVPAGVTHLTATVRWGDYRQVVIVHPPQEGGELAEQKCLSRVRSSTGRMAALGREVAAGARADPFLLARTEGVYGGFEGRACCFRAASCHGGRGPYSATRP